MNAGLKRPGRHGVHLIPSTAEVKNEWSSAPTIRLHGVEKDSFTFSIFRLIFIVTDIPLDVFSVML
jgi:hypothetical protein